jgi:hypothetical protein
MIIYYYDIIYAYYVILYALKKIVVRMLPPGCAFLPEIFFHERVFAIKAPSKRITMITFLSLVTSRIVLLLEVQQKLCIIPIN